MEEKTQIGVALGYRNTQKEAAGAHGALGRAQGTFSRQATLRDAGPGGRTGPEGLVSG